jgi:hypothetical protein
MLFFCGLCNEAVNAEKFGMKCSLHNRGNDEHMPHAWTEGKPQITCLDQDLNHIPPKYNASLFGYILNVDVYSLFVH